jgi:hypothetical protein
MKTSSEFELQSNRWLAGNSADRPSFSASVRRGLSGPRPFQVFLLPTGLLFLELKHRPGAPGTGPSGAVVAGAVLGGAIGACIGAAIASSMSGPAESESGFEYMDEDQLFDLARSRKRSFASKLDEIRSVSVDVPGFFSSMFAERTLVGWVTLRDSVLGKVQMDIHDPSAMALAIEALPRRLGDRVQVNVELDRRTAKFLPKR